MVSSAAVRDSRLETPMRERGFTERGDLPNKCNYARGIAQFCLEKSAAFDPVWGHQSSQALDDCKSNGRITETLMPSPRHRLKAEDYDYGEANRIREANHSTSPFDV